MFLFSSCTSVLMEDNNITSLDQKKIVTDTDKYRADLEAQIYACRKITRYVDLNDKRAQVISYFTDEEQIRKMKLTIWGNSELKYMEFIFLNNDVLLYVSENETFLNSPANEQSARPEQTFLNEYYFDDNTLICWLQQHEKRPPDLYVTKTREIFSGLESLLYKLSKKPESSDSLKSY